MYERAPLYNHWQILVILNHWQAAQFGISAIEQMPGAGHHCGIAK
jgi:hypothetical protein